MLNVIRRILLGFIAVIILFAAQASLSVILMINGAVPDFVLILIVSAALMRGSTSGLFVGFFAGLLCDVFFENIIGINALIYMLIGYFCGKFRKNFYAENMLQPLGMIAVSEMIYRGIKYIYGIFEGCSTGIIYYFINVMLGEAVYTAIAALLIYPVILRINTRLEDLDSRNERKFV